MNILHICNDYFGTKLYSELISELQKRGLNNIVYVPTKEKVDYEIKTDFNIVTQKCFSNIDRFFFYRKGEKVFNTLREKVDLKNINFIHAHTLFSNGYVALRCKEEYEIPYIVAVRNTDVNTFLKLRPDLRTICKKIIKNAENIIFLSSAYKYSFLKKHADLIEGSRNKVQVIPNGINDFWLENNYNSRKYINEKQTINILAVGEINKNKNYRKTIDVCQKLINSGYEVKLNIAGAILDKGVYRDICKSEFTQYRGVLDKENLIKLYRENDIFLLPSHKETFGLVYAEALSQGLPILYSEGQGFDGQFPDGKIGYSVKSNDVDDIVEKANLIIEKYDTIQARCADASKVFRWTNIAERYSKIYNID